LKYSSERASGRRGTYANCHSNGARRRRTASRVRVSSEAEREKSSTLEPHSARLSNFVKSSGGSAT
jgi:hypothetical protein